MIRGVEKDGLFHGGSEQKSLKVVKSGHFSDISAPFPTLF